MNQHLVNWLLCKKFENSGEAKWSTAQIEQRCQKLPIEMDDQNNENMDRT